jgi:hypothetical protein
VRFNPRITSISTPAILDRSAKTVDVLFRGSQEDIRYLNRDQISVDVCFENMRNRNAIFPRQLQIDFHVGS